VPGGFKLQNRVKHAFDKIKGNEGQVVIYGKKGHAEVVGLSGQTNEEAMIVMEENDLEKIDYSKPISLFSQTTKSTRGFYDLKSKIEERIKAIRGEEGLAQFDANDSICRQVSNREPQLRKFAKEHDVIVFVSGKKSSNGKALFNVCRQENERSYFIENEDELKSDWFRTKDTVGICGATSTPMWLMENIEQHIINLN
jgi:4-hydroxy-3-methylbut-2-enyl diphosphate reductase